MELTAQLVQMDLDALPRGYKTGDVDRLIRRYVKARAEVSALRPYILERQQLHRIYYYVSLEQIRDVEACYELVGRHFRMSKDSVQTVSHLLAIGEAPAQEKSERFLQMFEAFKAAS